MSKPAIVLRSVFSYPCGIHSQRSLRRRSFKAEQFTWFATLEMGTHIGQPPSSWLPGSSFSLSLTSTMAVTSNQAPFALGKHYSPAHHPYFNPTPSGLLLEMSHMPYFPTTCFVQRNMIRDVSPRTGSKGELPLITRITCANLFAIACRCRSQLNLMQAPP